MRTIALLTGLLFAIPATATDSPLDKADYVNCMAHAERTSMAALLKQPRDIAAGLKGALECDQDARKNLSESQLNHLALIYKLLRQQVENPSSIAHAQLTVEATKFLATLP